MFGLRAPRMLGAAALARPFYATLPTPVAPRPSSVATKLKTHSSTKKRFFPISGTGRGNAVATKFKRAHANKQHLNSGMSRVRLNRLEGTSVVARGAVARMLRRLLAPRL
ncbi:hypothetical protein MSPP1_001802 [Malassezia sp. CBS 17886]|nr:hypothetical protein MSPP1_001802 [Malassezia sp. CBS 17886]